MVRGSDPGFFVDEPEKVTPAQMDRWCRDFDNWAICDTVCFHLFDRMPHAFRKIARWSKSPEEFVKRAAFALLASVALHDKKSGDEPFAKCLPLVGRASSDGRNFVKKGVSWGLRGVGRRSPGLHAKAVALARRFDFGGTGGEMGWQGRAQGPDPALRDPAAPGQGALSEPIRLVRAHEVARQAACSGEDELF